MIRSFFILAISGLFFGHAQAQAVSEEKKMLKEIIKLRDSFVAAGFSESRALEKNPSWARLSFDAPLAVGIEGTRVLGEENAEPHRHAARRDKPREILVDKYPNTAYFVNGDVFNVAVLFDSLGKQRIIAPFTGEGPDAEKVNRVIAFIKMHGKVTGYKEYYYLNNYFRLGGMMNNDVEDQGFYMLEKKFYPDGFKEYLIVRAR
jgi:hypothetical protein